MLRDSYLTLGMWLLCIPLRLGWGLETPRVPESIAAHCHDKQDTALWPCPGATHAASVNHPLITWTPCVSKALDWCHLSWKWVLNLLNWVPMAQPHLKEIPCLQQAKDGVVVAHSVRLRQQWGSNSFLSFSFWIKLLPAGRLIWSNWHASPSWAAACEV